MRTSSIVHTGVAFTLLCLVAVAAGAEEAVPFRALLDSAVKNDPETVALREELEVRKSGVVRARTLPNPTLETELVTGRLTGSPDEGRYGLGINQEFPLWGKRANRQKAAEAVVRETEARLSARERVIAAEVRSRYLPVVLIEERRQIAEDAANLAKGLREVAESRFAEGDIPEYELNLAKAEEAAAENRKRETEREEAATKRELLLLVGLPEETVLPKGNFRPATPPEAELVSAALAQRPEVLAAQAEKDRAEAETLLAKREYLPDLTAGISVQRETSATDIDGRTFKDRATLIGLKFSMPIPVFDRNAAGIREAAARVHGAEERRRLLRGRIEREVKAAYQDLEAATKSLRYFEEKVLPPMRENVSVMQEAYQLGEAGISSVIQEQRKLLEALDTRHLLLKGVREAETKLETVAALPLTDEGGAR